MSHESRRKRMLNSGEVEQFDKDEASSINSETFSYYDDSITNNESPELICEMYKSHTKLLNRYNDLKRDYDIAIIERTYLDYNELYEAYRTLIRRLFKLHSFITQFKLKFLMRKDKRLSDLDARECL